MKQPSLKELLAAKEIWIGAPGKRRRAEVLDARMKSGGVAYYAREKGKSGEMYYSWEKAVSLTNEEINTDMESPANRRITRKLAEALKNSSKEIMEEEIQEETTSEEKQSLDLTRSKKIVETAIPGISEDDLSGFVTEDNADEFTNANIPQIRARFCDYISEGQRGRFKVGDEVTVAGVWHEIVGLEKTTVWVMDEDGKEREVAVDSID